MFRGVVLVLFLFFYSLAIVFAGGGRQGDNTDTSQGDYFTLSVTLPSAAVSLSGAEESVGSFAAKATTRMLPLPQPEPQDFEISVSPTQAQVVPGGSVDFSLTITKKGGFNGTITLTITGLPPGATVTVLGNASPFTLRISVSSGTLEDDYRLTISGQAVINGQTVTRSAVVILKVVNQVCNYSLTPATANFPSQGGNGTVEVSTTTDCNWLAASSENWIVLNNRSGSGSGRISYSVMANNSPQSRTGRITVANSVHTVQQAGADTVPPTVRVLSPNGGEMFEAGDKITIRWEASDNQEVVKSKVEILLGSNSILVADNLAGNIRSADYLIPPQAAGSTGLARVTVFDAAGNEANDTSDGTFTILAKDNTPPVVTLLSPRGGEKFTAGTQTQICFCATDVGSGIAYIEVEYSTDGGATFPNGIAKVAQVNQVFWNIPDGLKGNNIRVRVVAVDKSGNRGSATSGNITIEPAVEPTPKPRLRVIISFEPPPANTVAPPQNVRVTATEAKPDSPQLLAVVGAANVPSVSVVGYNIYRVQQPPEGQPMPTAEEVVKPQNMIASVGAGITAYTDEVTTAKGDNFAYSVSSTFGSGQQSGGSPPTGTSLPVIKNPRFDKQKGLVMDLAGSYIKPGATLTVDGKETYKLEVDSSGILYVVPKNQLSEPGRIKIKKMLKKGTKVILVVKNPEPDAKQSVSTEFTR
ncbi:MAG: BACON domain-containing protein [Acidobacteriota bacterium]|nr:BACON domain-containing protein [Blastocatellia bacterium]MDW8412772.1 BACON domain-containing protein [Acidobacteriota bacterium]